MAELSRPLKLCAFTLLVAALGLAYATPGRAAVTVGAPLSLPANETEGCEAVVFPSIRHVVGVPPSCTFYGADTRSRWTSQTPRGRWVITRARVRAGARVGPMVFTAMRAMRSQAGSPASGLICCVGAGESQTFTPAPNRITTVPVRIPVLNGVDNIEGEPVEVVDYLAITPLTLGSSVPLHRAASGAAGSTSNTTFIAPALRRGQQQNPGGSFPATVPLVNADLEPDADGDGLGDETQDGCPGRANRARVGAAGACSGGGGPPPPAPAPGAPTSPGGGTVPDAKRPRLSSVRLRGRVLRVKVSEAATVRMRIDRCRVRRVRGKRRRVCKKVKKFTARPAKRATIKRRLPRKVRKGRRYRLTVKATDRAGNRSKTLRRNIRIKKNKKK